MGSGETCLVGGRFVPFDRVDSTRSTWLPVSEPVPPPAGHPIPPRLGAVPCAVRVPALQTAAFLWGEPPSCAALAELLRAVTLCVKPPACAALAGGAGR